MRRIKARSTKTHKLTDKSGPSRVPNSKYPGFTSSDNSELSSSTKDSSPEHDCSKRTNHSESSFYSTCINESCDNISHESSHRSNKSTSLEDQSNSKLVREQKVHDGNPEVLRIQKELKKLAKNKRKTQRIIRQLKHQINSEEQLMKIKGIAQSTNSTTISSDSDKAYNRSRLCLESGLNNSSLDEPMPAGPAMSTGLKRKVASLANKSYDFTKEIQTVKTYVHTDGMNVCTSVTTTQSTQIREQDPTIEFAQHSATSSKSSCEFAENRDYYRGRYEKNQPIQLVSTASSCSNKHEEKTDEEESTSERLTFHSTDSNDYKEKKLRSRVMKWNESVLPRNKPCNHGVEATNDVYISGSTTPNKYWDASHGSSSLSSICDYQTLYQSETTSTPQSSYCDDTTDGTLHSSSEDTRHNEKPLMEEIMNSSSDSINTFLTNQSTHMLAQAVAIKHSAEDKLVESCRKKINRPSLDNACMLGISRSDWNPKFSQNFYSREEYEEFPEIADNFPSSPIYKSYSQSSCVVPQREKELGVAVSFSSGNIPEIMREPCDATRAIRKRLNLLSIIKSGHLMPNRKSDKKISETESKKSLKTESSIFKKKPPISTKHQATDTSSLVNACKRKTTRKRNVNEECDIPNIVHEIDRWNKMYEIEEMAKSRYINKYASSPCTNQRHNESHASHLEAPNNSKCRFPTAEGNCLDRGTLDITESAERIYKDLRTNSGRVKTRHHQLRNIFKRKVSKK